MDRVLGSQSMSEWGLSLGCSGRRFFVGDSGKVAGAWLSSSSLKGNGKWDLRDGVPTLLYP